MANIFDQFDEQSPAVERASAVSETKNVFDQFDTAGAGGTGNVFDQFDAKTSFGEDALEFAQKAGTETYRVIVGGVRDAAQNTLDLGRAIGDAVERPIARALGMEDAFDAMTKRVAATAQLPEVEAPSGAVSQLTREGVRLGVGMVAGSKGLSAAGVGPGLARNVGAGVVGDAVTSSGTEGRLSDVLAEHGLSSGVTAPFETKEGDSELVGRLKNAGEGILVGGVADVAVPAVKGGLAWIGRRPEAIREGMANRAFIKDLRSKPDFETPEVPDIYIRDDAGALNRARVSTQEYGEKLLDDLADNHMFDAGTAERMNRAATQADMQSNSNSNLNINAERVKATDDKMRANAQAIRELQERIAGGDNTQQTAFNLAVAIGQRRKLVAQSMGEASEWGRTGAALRSLLQNTGMIPPEVQKQIVKEFGGSERLKDLSSLMNKLDPADPDFLKKQGRLIDIYTQSKPSESVMGVLYNGLLSSPSTHVANALSNALVQATDLAEHSVAAGIGAIRKTEGRVTMGEVKWRATGMMQHSVEAWKAAMHAFDTGQTDDMISKFESKMNADVSTKHGLLISTPTRALQGADQFFKVVSRYQTIYGDAYANAMKDVASGKITKDQLGDTIENYIQNPSKQTLRQGEKEALYKTFQQEGGPWAKWAMSGRERLGVTGNFIAPFIKTPANVMKYAFERLPVVGMVMDTNKAMLKEGGRSADMVYARMALGTAAVSSAAMFAAAGFVQGMPEQKPGDRNVAQTNNELPYSWKIGDRWVSYSRLDPVGILFGIGADSVAVGNAIAEWDLEKITGASIAMMTQTLVNKSWMQGVTTSLLALMLPNQFGQQLETQFGSWLVPSLSAADARAYDQAGRDVRSLWDSVKARSRFSRGGLMPQVDALGRIREIGRPAAFGLDTKASGQGGAMDKVKDQADYLVRMASPFAAGDVEHDQVAIEMKRIGFSITKPQRTFAYKGARAKLDNEQYFTLSYVRGSQARVYLERVMSKPGYQNLNAAQRQEVFGMAFEKASKDARRVLAFTYPQLKDALREDMIKQTSVQFKDSPSSMVEVFEKWFYNED